MNPLVSVLVSTYNRADLIGETIQSILNQTHRDLELIIVDDGSTDNTREVVGSFSDRRIKYIFTDNWGGPARPRNIGIREAKGNYIAFCDDDDYWDLRKLEIQLRHFYDDIIGVGSSALKVGNLTFRRCGKKVGHDYILDFNMLLSGKTAPLSSLVIRNKNLLFDENEDFKFVEDFEFQLRITYEQNKKIKVISEPLIFYRIHAKNESADIKKAENIFKVFDKYMWLMSAKQIAKCYYRSYLNLGIKSLRIGDQMAKGYFFLAFKYAHIGKKYLLLLLLVFFSKFPRKLRDRILLVYYKFCNL